MSRRSPRLLFVASLVAGASFAPMLSAYAQDTRLVIIEANKFGVNGESDANKSDKVIWEVKDGNHTVTPYEPKEWGDNAGSALLKAGESWDFTFTKAGEFRYYCEIHGGGTKDDPEGMWGVVKVRDPNAPPPPPPPTQQSTTTTSTTAPAVVPGPPAPVTTSTTAAPPKKNSVEPTTTTKGKDRKPKEEEEETTTTTAPPPPAPIDLPDSAIIPALPGYTTDTTTQDGIAEPGSAPEGEAVALLKSSNGGGGKAKTLLIFSGLGLGALGLGTAGYKYANRSSKYFPA